ncbi:MAG: sulfurtransferase TusA family protein [Chloroflexi bacterium]|nr:sulfurtransferase TusA family protein [Chloroflexota bacterium]
MAEIAPDQVLEVISPEPRARTEIPEWCRMTGNELLHVHENEDETLFWIRKTGRGAAGPAGFPFAVGDDVHGPDVERRTEVGRDT